MSEKSDTDERRIDVSEMATTPSGNGEVHADLRGLGGIEEEGSGVA